MAKHLHHPPREAAEPTSPQLPPRNPFGPLTSVEVPSENLHTDDVNGIEPDTDSEDEPRSGGSHRICANPKFHPTITVGTHNWNGSAFDETTLRANLYSKERIDVLAVTDHRLNDQYLHGLSAKGYHWIPGSRPEGLSGGVGFLVRLFLKGFVTEVESSAKKNQKWIRLAPMDGAGDSLPLYIGAAYMPQEGAADADEAWDALDADAEKYRRLGEVVLLGDLNAKIRCRLRGEESFLGPHCAPPSDGARSANGWRLVELAKGRGLRIVNTEVPNKRRADGTHWTTRVDPNGNESQLDYILTSTLDSKPVFKVKREDGGSDHWLVYARIQFQRRRLDKRKKRRYKRIRVETLIDSGGGKYRSPLPVWSTQEEKDTPPDINQSRADYVKELGERLRGFAPEEVKMTGDTKKVAGEMVQDLCSRILTAAKKSLETRTVVPAYRTPWFDEECRAAIDERRALYKVWLRTKQGTDYVAYRGALRRCRKLVRAKKVEYREEMTRRLQREANGSSREFWRRVERELGSSKRSQNSPGCIQIPGHPLAVSAEERREAWAEYREMLGTPPQDVRFDATFFEETKDWAEEYLRASWEDRDQELDKPFSDEEVIQAMKKIKHHKSPGMDGISNELLKYGGLPLLGALLKLFNKLHAMEVFPRDWGKAACVQLYKSGERTDPGNYRGIALISCLGKLYLTL